MNRYHLFAIILLICGIISLGYSVASGEGSAGVVVFIPVFFGSGLFSFIGVLCIMAAIFLAFMGFAKGTFEDVGVMESPGRGASSSQSPQGPRAQKSIKGGGVVLIGPIPIVFGSDAKTAMVLMVLAIILIIVVAVLFYSSLL
jgi:uncharacterized protein (TIGR00304 family)